MARLYYSKNLGGGLHFSVPLASTGRRRSAPSKPAKPARPTEPYQHVAAACLVLGLLAMPFAWPLGILLWVVAFAIPVTIGVREGRAKRLARKAGDTRTVEQRARDVSVRSEERAAHYERRVVAYAADRRARGKWVNEKRAAKFEARVAAKREAAARLAALTAQDRSWLAEHGWTAPE